jgi:hypothetical protein
MYAIKSYFNPQTYEEGLAIHKTMIILCEMLKNVGQLNTMVTCVSSFKGHSMNINRSWYSDGLLARW